MDDALAALGSRFLSILGAVLTGLTAMPVGAQTPAEGNWTTYRHPTGAFIEHPQEWRTQVTQMGIALVPPDFDPNAELIIALGESAFGLSGPTDPQIGQYFDVLMAQVAPAMRRSGQPSPIEFRAGQGALYEYRGVLNTGQSAEARFHTALLAGQAIAIAIVATDEKMRQRERTVQRIFASLGHAEPQRDPRLVGTWQSSSSESESSSSGSVLFRTDSEYTLTSDGRLISRTRSQGNVTGAAGGTAVRRSEEQAAGTWSAADGRLFILWEDGTSSSASYETSGDAATVRIDGAERPIRLQRVR